MRARFAALQITGAGLLVALWLSGVGPALWHADHTHVIPVLSIILVAGLGLVATHRWDDAHWVKDLLPSVGMVGTVYGAVSVGLLVIGGGQDLLSKETVVGILLALISNLVAMAAFVWLSATLRVCEPRGC